MRKVPIRNLEPGMHLGEDLFRMNDRAKKVPLFSFGILLTERNIAQIQRLFPNGMLVNVFDRDELVVRRKLSSLDSKAQSSLSAEQQENQQLTVRKKRMFTSPIPYDQLKTGEYPKEKVVKMFSDSIMEKNVYKNTKKKVVSYLSKVTSVLSAFTSTGRMNEERVMDVAQEITSDLVEGTDYIDLSLLFLVELEEWDRVTFNHSFDVGVLTLLVASHMSDQYEELTSLFIAGVLHDIGKFIYSKYKLNDMDYIIKKPGRLTQEELEQVKRHVDVKDYIEDWFPNLPVRLRDNIIYGILEHHERIDGSGYLRGKKGQNISFAGRLIGIIDVYDALIRRRSYKTLLTPSQAVSILLKMEGENQFDRTIFSYFYKAVGRYPNGGVVMTNNGIALVSGQNPADPERPFLIFPNSTDEVNTLNQPEIEIYDL